MTDAKLDQLSEHLARQSAHDLPDDGALSVTGHRIVPGRGTIIALREFASPWPRFSDKAGFNKVTIYLDDFRLDGSATKIELIRSTKVIGFWSNGLSAFPEDAGCVGYSDSGSITFTGTVQLREGAPVTGLSANIRIRVRDVRSYGVGSGCEPFTIEQSVALIPKSVGSLTPWEGRSGAHIYDETYFGPR